MKITTFSKTIIRLPSFSFSYLKDILSLSSDQWVIQILANDLFMQGIMIASPEFYDQAINYELYNDCLKKDKIRLTLLKYLIRSSTRCVPFGLFSGLGVLDSELTDENQSGNILIDEISQYNRLDSGFSSHLIDEINELNEVRSHLNYFTNTTLYQKLPILK